VQLARFAAAVAAGLGADAETMALGTSVRAPGPSHSGPDPRLGARRWGWQPCRSPSFGGGKRVGLAGQRGQGGGDFSEAGADVGRGGAGLAAAVGVPGVGAGDSVPEIPFDPRQRRVTDPVTADLLGAHPGQLPAQTGPQMVIPAGGDRVPVGVAQQLPVGRGMPLPAVLGEPGHQGG